MPLEPTRSIAKEKGIVKRSVAAGRKNGKKRKRLRWKRWVFGLPFAVLVPFLLLIRMSTWLYMAKAMNGWFAIAISGAVAGLLLGLLVVAVGRRFGLRLKVKTLRSMAILVSIYCVYLLMFISASNVKTDELVDTYTNLHPVLRVALSSLIVVDRELLVTDTSRTPEDYARMGLAENSGSHHFEQNDGYVHAVDLRTNGRTDLQNQLTKFYFDVMGFSTLRHVGTADHLHVSLPNRRR